MNKEKGMLLGAMSIFGSIGIFVKYIPLPATAIALCRAILGLLFLLLVMAIFKKKPDKVATRNNLGVLIISGAAMGFNWLLLFESYRYTTVATATVCYYLAPVLLLLTCPLLGEKLTAKKFFCVVIALVGLVGVSGVMEGSIPQPKELAGIGFGLGAAVLYASVMFCNKKLSEIDTFDKTILQLGSAAVVLLPYLLLTEQVSTFSLSGVQLLLLIIVGIVHTGFAYTLYFGALTKLSAKTIGVFCYLDPVIAVILSAVLLKEPITFFQIIGTALILGSALANELPTKENRHA